MTAQLTRRGHGVAMAAFMLAVAAAFILVAAFLWLLVPGGGVR